MGIRNHFVLSHSHHEENQSKEVVSLKLKPRDLFPAKEKKKKKRILKSATLDLNFVLKAFLHEFLARIKTEVSTL